VDYENDKKHRGGALPRISYPPPPRIRGVIALAVCAAAVFGGCRAAAVGGGGGDEGVPALVSLEFDTPLVTLVPDFTPGCFDYTVELPAETPPLTLSAEGAAGVAVSYLTGATFMPFDGTVAVIAASLDNGKSVNYVISFRGAAQSLPQAALSAIELSSGVIENFSPAQYSYSVEVPYGTRSVTLNAAGAQEGSYFTYTPAVSVDFAGGGRQARIGVAAQNYAPSNYTITFTEAAARDSELEGVAFSTGALTTAAGEAVDFNPQAGGEQFVTVTNDTTQLIVWALKKQWSDAVRMNIGGTAVDGVTGVIEDPLSLEGKVFSITVNGGEGCADRVYQFRVSTADKENARLTNLSAEGASLMRREENGGNGDAAFAGTHAFYNLNFNHGASGVTLNAAAEAGTVITINGQTSASLTISNPKAADPPVRVMVSAPDKLASVYTVYLVKTNPPPAELASLTLLGGTLTRSFSPQDHNQYSVRTLANAASLIVRAAGAESSFAVTYTPDGILAPPINATITVHVDGGPDWTPTEYRLAVQVLANQSPRLQELSIDGVEVALSGESLVYSRAVPFGQNGARDIPLTWSVDEVEVELVQYSFSGGASWISDVNKDGFSGELSLLPSAQAVVLVKVKTYDGNMAIYYLSISRGAPGGDIISLSYNYGENDITPQLSGQTTVIRLPMTCTQVAVSVDALPALGANPSILFTPSSTLTWANAADLSAQTMVISASGENIPQGKIYLLNFNKRVAPVLSDFTATSITLSWQEIQPTPLSYTLYRSNDGTAYTSLGSKTSPYIDSGLTPGFAYSYKLAAVYAAGEDEKSAGISGMTLISAVDDLSSAAFGTNVFIDGYTNVTKGRHEGDSSTPADFNQSASGAFTRIGYNVHTVPVEDAIAEIKVLVSGDGTPPSPWVKLPANINQGTGGSALYLAYRLATPLDSAVIDFIGSYATTGSMPSLNAGYEWVKYFSSDAPADTNKGVSGSADIQISVRKKPVRWIN
jgi:hypothetical protein